MDCFLLDGEVFIIKAALSLLICCESELLKSSHYQIKDKLKNMKAVGTEHLFAVIMDSVKVDEELYLREVKK